MGYVLLPAGTVAPIGRSSNTFSATRPPALLSRAIDPKTGEISSLFYAPHPIDAAMIFAARAQYQSGVALGEVGTRYHKINQGTDNAPAEFDAETKRWTRPFVERQLIELVKTQVEVEGDLGAAFVAYSNRLTNKSETTR